MEKKIPTEIYSRVVGYFRPVNQWNKGKKEEFKERIEFEVTEKETTIKAEKEDREKAVI